MELQKAIKVIKEFKELCQQPNKLWQERKEAFQSF